MDCQHRQQCPNKTSSIKVAPINTDKVASINMDLIFIQVNFHPMDPSLLASGSQDGIMKFFDLRSFDMVTQFLSNTGSVRDLQFNPHAFYQVIQNITGPQLRVVAPSLTNDDPK